MRQIKNILLLLFIHLSFYNSWAQSTDQGLIAFYPFDKAPSIIPDQEIKDNSKYKNTGTYIGNITYVKDRHGVDCRAISFDGNSYISIPNSLSLSSPTTQFTAAVWVKITNGADFYKQWLTILCKSNSIQETTNSPHYRMQATAETVSINTDFTELFTPQLSYDTWYFYAYVYDGSKVKVYLDGEFVFEYNYSLALEPNSMPMEIGRDLPGAIEYFNGAMDDLRLYNRALSDNELSQLYNDISGVTQQSACEDKLFETDDLFDSTNDDEVIKIAENDPIYDDFIEEEIEEDTVSVQDFIPDNYEDLPETVEDIPVDYQKTIIVKSKNIKIYPYDNEKEDGDIVSININGVWVRNRLRIRKKKSQPAKGDYIHVSLNEGSNNYIISKAMNVGSIPPNTLTIEIDDGVSIQELMINSDRGTSGGIRIMTDFN